MTVDQGRIIGATAVVLAGGRGRRFGSDKALALLNGDPLIHHVTTCLEQIFSLCIIAANEAEKYAFLGLPVIPDRYPNRGHLSGIHAALGAITTPWAFVAACDMPRLNPRLINFLWSVIPENPDALAVLPCSRRGPEPLYAFYHRRALPVLERCLQGGRNRLRDALSGLRPRLVRPEEMPPGCDDPATFRNVNRPEELEALQRDVL